MYTGLSNSKRKTYLGIANGRITYKPNKDAEIQQFENLDGRITGITRRDTTINGNNMPFYDINFVDNQGEVAVLSVVADGSVARSLVLAIAAIPDLSKPVRIRAYSQEKDGRSFTGTVVYQNNEKVPWIIPMEELPKGEPVMSNGKHFEVNGVKQYNFEKRNKVIEDYVNAINEAVAKVASDDAPDVDFDNPNDMPADL